MNNMKTGIRRRLPGTEIFDVENWREISATLAKNKTRTFLTGFGIFWGVFMLAALLGGAQGAKDLLLRNFEGLATNSAIMASDRTSMPYKGYAKNRSYSLDMTDVERLRQALPEVATVTADQFQGGCSFVNGRHSVAGQVMGVEPEFSDVMEPKIYSGRFINENDMATGRKVCVIGKRVAEQIFPTIPDPVGQIVQVNGISYKIVGMAGQLNELQMGGRIDEEIILPFTTFRKAFGTGEELDVVMLVARDGYRIANLKDRIRRVIYSRHYIHPQDESALWIMDISEEFEKVDMLFLGVSLLAGFIGFSTLIAGIIGIGNIMWVIVRERTQEIGIRRALGAKPRDIIVQILSEGMALTFIAGTAGITFAAIALGITQHMTANEVSTPQFQLLPQQALWIMGVFLVLGSLAGLIPAVKAMRIKPIEALSSK